MTSKTTLSRLVRNHAFLRGLGDDQVARLESMGVEASFDENEVILLSGQRSMGFYLILAGSVAVELNNGAFIVCVQALLAHEVFGWSALLDEQDTVFQVRARERTTAVRWEGADLSETFRTDPQLGVEFLRRTLRVVAGRVKATEEKFAEMCGVRL